MIIVDSSIWIDHFRRPNAALIEAAVGGRLLQHPLITLELALGSIPQRDPTLGKLQRLPQPTVLSDDQMLEFVDEFELARSGIGPIDASVLASAARTEKAKLWTRDKRLGVQAERLGLNFAP